jgi:hypothetical protein
MVNFEQQRLVGLDDQRSSCHNLFPFSTTLGDLPVCLENLIRMQPGAGLTRLYT